AEVSLIDVTVHLQRDLELVGSECQSPSRRSRGGQGSCTTDVPGPALAACRGERVAFPVEGFGQKRARARRTLDVPEAEALQHAAIQPFRLDFCANNFSWRLRHE